MVNLNLDLLWFPPSQLTIVTNFRKCTKNKASFWFSLRIFFFLFPIVRKLLLPKKHPSLLPPPPMAILILTGLNVPCLVEWIHFSAENSLHCSCHCLNLVIQSYIILTHVTGMRNKQRVEFRWARGDTIIYRTNSQYCWLRFLKNAL